MEITKSRITFIRGDDDALMVALKNGKTFQDGDKVYFSLKATPADEEDLLQIVVEEFQTYNGIENAAVLIKIAHADTIELALGKYYYDILIEWADTDVRTVVKPTIFTLVAGGSHV